MLPLPDLDFDDSLDFSDVCSTYSPISMRLSNQEISELSELSNMIIDFESPIKASSGAFVCRAKFVDDDTIYAVKISPHKKRIRHEFNTRFMFDFKSQYLLKSLNYFESTTKSMLLMELAENGDIKDLIMPEIYLWKLVHDVGSALFEIHSNGMIHLDVSPGNILVMRDRFKLSDFGTVLKVGTFESGDEGAGPYVSPEALTFPNGGYPVNQQTDIFSFGIVLLEMATGKHAPRGGSKGYSMIRSEMIKLGDENYPCFC